MEMKKQYDFDVVTDRTGTGAAKWNMMDKAKPMHADGIVPFSVADMEFQIAPEIKQAMHDYVEHCIPGYSVAPEGYAESVCAYLKRRHGLEVCPEHLLQTPGIVYALPRAIRALTEEGDGVIIMTPVYHHFAPCITDAGRTVVTCPLVYENGAYTIDFDTFDRLAAEKTNTALLMCSPHNPVGRVWTAEEVNRVAEICQKHGLGLIADEIHFDLVFPGHTHISFGTLEGPLAERTILCTSPSKTFNLAGMNLSNIVVRNAELRKKMVAELRRDDMPMQTPFGFVACRAAYEQGEAWLAALLEYLDGNRKFVRDYIHENLPQLHPVELEGTYLQWIDCRALGLEPKALEELMLAHDLFLDEGYVFGEEGAGFERINLACPRSILEGAMERLKDAVNSL